VTDFDAHAMWMLQNVDWYFVACEETRVYLAALGISSETILVTGIPIDPIFAIERPKRETRLRLGLDPDKTIILVSVGGFGVGEGRLKNFPPLHHPMKVVGFTSEMDSWMAASDLLVEKPGGLTSSEALARGLVLVIVNPIPGQEERNSDHFLEEGVGIRCNNLPALAYKIDTLLADRERFLRMQQAIRRMARPDAARKVVPTVLKSRD
jgi:processive 1,2-diacylglycerol beta-glucosyltransferase